MTTTGGRDSLYLLESSTSFTGLFQSCDFLAPCSPDKQLKRVVLCSVLHLGEQKCSGCFTATGIGLPSAGAPWGAEANAFSDGNSCRNSCSVLLEATFCNVGKPVALAELLAAMPEDTMRTRQEPHSQTR